MGTCAIVAACEFNESDFAGRTAQGAIDFIIAADAGLEYVEHAGCVPDMIVGDFDSLGYVPQGGNVEVHPVHKDESDFELALRIVQERGFDRVIAYGALGGRLDHTIANLHIGARLAETGTDVSFIGLDAVVKILVGPASYELPLLDEGTVSVFSAMDEAVGVSEEGMEYPLQNARLRNRTTLGLSNELLGRPASVSVERGTLYVFHPLPECRCGA